MKKSTRSLLACTLALSLAIPAIAVTDASAAGKKPTLKPKSATTILTGKTKTFTIKNVKKKNVKSLKVKVYNKHVAKLGKKILTKKKVGFTIKGIGGGLSDMEVTLKLKKKQAGKKVYKFSNITIQSGVTDAPEGVLSDLVTTNSLTALVLKAGTSVTYDNWENALNLDIINNDAIGGRNIFIHWYENGKEKDDWCRDAAGGKVYRPDSPASTVTAPAAASGSAVSGSAVSGTATTVSGSSTSVSGSAAAPTRESLGIVENTYYCELENMLSGKKSKTNTKLVRIVPQSVIDYSISYLATFKSKYPTAAIPTDSTAKAAFIEDFSKLTNTLGYNLGITSDLFVAIKTGVELVKSDPKLLQELILNEVSEFTASFVAVGKYLGISDADVKAYTEYFGAIVGASVNDTSIDITKLMV